MLSGDLVDTTGPKEAHVHVDRHMTVDDARGALVADHPELEDLVDDGADLAEPVHARHHHCSVIGRAGLATELAVVDLAPVGVDYLPVGATVRRAPAPGLTRAT